MEKNRKMKLDKIIISCDCNPTYYKNLPLVYHAYKKFFPEVCLVLAFINEPCGCFDEYPLYEYCDELVHYNYIKGIPSCNQGKMVRYYTAAQYGNQICMINDIDLIPLQREYYFNKLTLRRPNYLLAVGANVYQDKKLKGKFPIAYMTGEGYLFERLLNPNKLKWGDYLRQFTGLRIIDGKEDILKPIKLFSDESLIRAYIKRLNGKVIHADKDFKPHVDSITRIGVFKQKKLDRGNYIESHHVIPYAKFKNKVDAISKYLGFEYKDDWIK